MPSERDAEELEIEARLNQLINDRCRITDDDFKLGLPPDTEARIIDRMTDAGYTIGLDEDHRNEWWWPPLETEDLDNAD